MSDKEHAALGPHPPGLPASPVQGGIDAAVPASVRFPQEPIDRFLAGEISFDDLQGMSVYDAYAVAEAGHRLYQRGRTRDAQTLFEGLAMANPYDAYFQSMLGAVFHAGGDDTSALSHYDRALELNPEGLYARVNRAQLHLKRGSPEDALNDLEDAIQRSQTRGLSESEQRLIRQAQVLLRGTSQTLEVLSKASDDASI
ncbi:MAG: tetratricopeptide repeat protein [Myxococcota bacterium]